MSLIDLIIWLVAAILVVFAHVLLGYAIVGALAAMVVVRLAQGQRIP